MPARPDLRIRRLVLAVGLVASTILVLMPAGAVSRSESFGRSGFQGEGVAVMQSVTVPARVGRVQAVPGSKGAEVWAIGLSDANLEGWDRRSPGGQTVFLRYLRGAGWDLMGPPRDTSGEPFNPTLYSFSIAPGGEGWAVGADAVMLRKAAGSTTWVEVPAAEEEAGRGTEDPAQLDSVSLTDDGGLVGFAAGVTGGSGPNRGTTILKYLNGRWSRQPAAEFAVDGSPELISVSTVSREVAWAITGSASRDLRVYRRDENGWHPANPDPDPQYPVFGGPHVPTARMRNGGFNAAAFGGTVAADASGAWVGGQMFPSDVRYPSGDDTAGDRSRPFVLRFSADGSRVTSYCPDQYSVNQRTNDFDSTVVCDRPFPLALYDVTSISLLPNGEAFAGGLGLFHFRDGGWSREPDASGYLISTSFSSPTEGWVATTGNFYGAGGAVGSSENTVGHWTSQPSRARVAMWPQPQLRPLQAVAIQPGGSNAIAVGTEGAVLGYVPDVGWDTQIRVSLGDLHAVAWASGSSAWAAGEHGVLQHFDGKGWKLAPESEKATTNSLFGVAFASANDGVAVGAQGTLLRFDGRSWRTDPASGKLTRERLLAVAAGGGRVVAVGSRGTLLERVDGAWRAHPEVAERLKVAGLDPPSLNAAAVLPDATVIAGGQRSSLVIRRPGGEFEKFERPLQGNILALAATQAEGRLRIYASLDPDSNADASKFKGERMYSTRSVLVAFDGRRWQDLSLSRLRTIYGSTDSSRYVDPVYYLALDSSGSGWGVGGIPASQPDDEHPGRVLGTSAVYRFDLASDPEPPFARADVSFASGGVNFAFLAETWCERGICSMTMGTGTQADEVPLQAQREINLAARLPNGPRFLMFGGNGRKIGLPEELAELRGFLEKFSLPVYGAVGNRDLLGGLTDVSLNNVISGGDSLARSLGAGERVPGPTPEMWKREFVRMPAPWGSGPRPQGVGEPSIPGAVDPDPSLARTHYAFDYKAPGRKPFRIVVIDSSTRSYGKASDQNPPNEDQRVWVPNVLKTAFLGGTPTIVVMNQPTIVPDRTPQINWTADRGGFEGDVSTNAVSAVLTGGPRWNIAQGLPADLPVVPLYIMGGGGAPLGYEKATAAAQEPTKLPTDGYYNAWFLVNIDPSKPSPLNLPGQALVTVRPFPVLDYVSIHAVDGRSQSAGNVLSFSALARGVTGGVSDPEQSKTTYFQLGSFALPVCGDSGQGNGSCAARDALRPPYRFYSENPEIADFVAPDLARGVKVPLRDANRRIVREIGGTHGLLCTFKLGSTYINVESGFQRARMRITVAPGFGPCVDEPQLAPAIPPIIAPAGPLARPAFFRHPPPPLDVTGFLLPPAPGPIPAPAPPASAAGARKEEEEYQHESEGQKGEGEEAQEFRAIAPERRGGFDPMMAWLLVGSTSLLAIMLAMVASASRQRAIRAIPVQGGHLHRIRW